MYFLIDFENVKNAGMQGTEYLENSALRPQIRMLRPVGV